MAQPAPGGPPVVAPKKQPAIVLRKEEEWKLKFMIFYDDLLKPMKEGEKWLTKDQTMKLWGQMLGDPPIAVGSATPAVDRDILPEVWAKLWEKIPHTVLGKPELVNAADALEHCILYGIEIGAIWSRLKTDMEKFELSKKEQLAIEFKTRQEEFLKDGWFSDITLVNQATKAQYQ